MSDTGSDNQTTAQNGQESAQDSSPQPATSHNHQALASTVREHIAPDEVAGPRNDDAEDEKQQDVESPAKIIRIGAMIKQLLEEVRNSDLDGAAREQLGRIYANAIDELKTAMSPELGAELESLSFLFDEESSPSEAELRLAQAQLVGWLEGLFHGIQATLMAQQMTARQQLEGMRSQAGLPDRSSMPTPGPGYL